VHLWQRGVLAGERCGCGAPFHDCPFWRRVGAIAFGGWHNADVDRISSLRRQVDRNRFIPLLATSEGPPAFRRALSEYLSVYLRLYTAVAEASNCPIVVDSSTISPSAELQFAERLRAKGVEYIDAPVTGSKVAAQAGSLIFMVGGDEAVLAKLEPLFQAMGKQVFRMGETSKGQAAKLVMNLQIALIYEGFAEALTLAAKLGVNVDRLLPLIQASMVKSGVVEYKAPFILKRDFTPNFPLRLMLKDIHLALDAAKEARVKLPALETVQDVYEMAAEDGHEDLDYAATLTLLEKWAGVEVKGAA